MTRLLPVATPAEHAELTLKRQPWRASQLVAELERCWYAITDLHPELPAVVIIVGAGELTRGDGLRLRRFSPCRWQLVDHSARRSIHRRRRPRARQHPGAGDAAAPAAPDWRTSARCATQPRAGRYHNRRYLAIAEGAGLQVAHHPQLGWSTTTLSDSAQLAYRPQLRADIDPHWAGIGASLPLIERLIGDPLLDAVKADPTAKQPFYR